MSCANTTKGGARGGLGGPMCVRVQRVSSMPFNVQVWVDDSLGCFKLYIDEDLITDAGATSLEQILRTTVTGWQRLDESVISRALRAVTG